MNDDRPLNIAHLVTCPEDLIIDPDWAKTDDGIGSEAEEWLLGLTYSTLPEAHAVLKSTRATVRKSREGEKVLASELSEWLKDRSPEQ